METPHLLKPFFSFGLIVGAFPYTIKKLSQQGKPEIRLKFNVISGLLSILGVIYHVWAATETAKYTKFNADSMDELFSTMADWMINFLGLLFRLYFCLFGKKFTVIINELINIISDLDKLVPCAYEKQKKTKLVEIWKSAKWPLYVLFVVWFPFGVLGFLMYHYVALVRVNWDVMLLSSTHASYCKSAFCSLFTAFQLFWFHFPDVCLQDLALVCFCQCLVNVQKKLRKAATKQDVKDLDVTLAKIHLEIYHVAEELSNNLGPLIVAEYLSMVIFLSARILGFVKVLLSSTGLQLQTSLFHQMVTLVGHLLRIFVAYSTSTAVNEEVTK